MCCKECLDDKIFVNKWKIINWEKLEELKQASKDIYDEENMTIDV